MAVVQISRIQQRRGKKNAGTGFPQLASGEIGWAIDTQELYIGNGSVSEGSPYVGNTQILTEHVNILEFVGAYQYQKNNPIIQTGVTATTPIERTLQQRLDERVSVKSFGVKGDGIADDTEALQRAIDQLFLNDASKATYTSRVKLWFEPGEYLISDQIKIPPYVHLVGSGIDSTVIHKTADSSSLFRMVDANSTPGNYTEFASMSYLQRPRQILIEDMTLQTDQEETIVLLDNTDTTIFSRVKFVGVFDNGTNPFMSTNVKQTGTWIRSTSGLHRTENVQFHSCIWNNTGYGVYSTTDHDTLSFLDCTFYQLFDGINTGGDTYGAVNTKVEGCFFDLIDRYGIWIKKGYGNSSIGNKYMLVGDDNNGYANATYPIIRYDTFNNISENDYFERNSKLKDQNIFGLIAFKPNVQSPGRVADTTTFRKSLDENLVVPLEFFRFPVTDSSTFVVDYVINKTTLGSAVRTGKLHITVNIHDSDYHIQDEFSYTGSNTVENVEFSASLVDYDGDLAIDTLVLKIFNPSGNGTGTMNYSYYTMTR
jgi:hypothetical protein